ncbi:MAG: hypothetical protein J7K61_05770, partial [Thermoplasmata archaeon]|nr:hypothetical protein [Thermoplasmata archaeon]
KTKLVGLSEALKENGRDDAEKVKYFIKDEIENDGIKYVMLVGDANNFPVRYSYTYDGEEEKFVSDLYYADIYDADGAFSSWDSNGNGVYGEYNHNGNTDAIDLYPDVYVGRLACSNQAELDTVVSKIIEYESNAHNQPWTKRIVGFGGDSHDDSSGIYEGEKIKDEAFKLFTGYDIVKYYTSDNTLSKTSIIDEFKHGGLLYNFAGHGNRISWATHPPKQFNTWIGFDITDIYKFSNGDKLPLIILNACETGQFDKGMCLAWKLVSASNRGGIASMAATALSWEYVGSGCTYGLSGYLDVKFCRYFDKGTKAGDVLEKAITDYIRYQPMDSATHYKVVEEWTLFGDPTLVIGGYEGGGDASVKISSPEHGYIYIAGNKIMPTIFGRTVVIGDIDINVSAYNCNKVEFYLDGELKYTDDTYPYSWKFDERAFFSHQITVIGYGNESKDDDSINLMIFHL